MPVEFLSQERRERLGRFSDDPTAEQLARYFHLDDADRGLVNRRARERARLGFALQLGTVRFLGTFLADPTDVPRVVVEYVARQLGIVDLSVLKGYGDSETRWDHAAEIRRDGYRDFGDEAVHGRLREWLEARAWTMGERRGVLFDLAVAWLLEHKVLLPGPTVLERFVASVHDHAAARLCPHAGVRANPVGAPGARAAPRRPARRPPKRLRPTPPRAEGAVCRRDRGCAPPSRGGASARSQRPRPRRRAPGATRSTRPLHGQGPRPGARSHGLRAPAGHLVAFAATLETTALDDVLDAFDLVVGELLGRAARKAERERLQTLGDLDAAALVLRDTFVRLRQAAAEPDVDLRRLLLDKLTEPELDAALETVTSVLESSEDDRHAALLARYGTIRQAGLGNRRYWGGRSNVRSTTLSARERRPQ